MSDNPDFREIPWLAEHRNDPRVRIVDARSTPHGGVVAMPSGREQYAAGHIPGAIHLDYADDLSDPATPYAARVAPPERFANVMSEHGIGDDTIVVAYDAGTIPFAARLVWMLRYYGHDQAYVLAGAYPAWIAAGYPLSTEAPIYPPATFTPKPRPELRATRGGRIADRTTLENLIQNAGLDKHARTVVSCGSGVSASGAWLALRAAGFDDVAVYDGSWMEWEHDALPTVPKSPR